MCHFYSTYECEAGKCFGGPWQTRWNGRWTSCAAGPGGVRLWAGGLRGQLLMALRAMVSLRCSR